MEFRRENLWLWIECGPVPTRLETFHDQDGDFPWA